MAVLRVDRHITGEGRYVAWSATAREAEARVFDNQPEALQWSFAESNREGVVDSGFRRVPAKWTNKGALTWALNRAHAAQETR